MVFGLESGRVLSPLPRSQRSVVLFGLYFEVLSLEENPIFMSTFGWY